MTVLQAFSLGFVCGAVLVILAVLHVLKRVTLL